MKRTVGKSLFDIVTAGMYSAPLMALREYLQNSVDAIDAAIEARLLARGKDEIRIVVDGASRSISIQDNGVGVHPKQATVVLSALGISTKEAGEARGFRGIGRLGGIGYCKSLVFRTKASNHPDVTEVTWDCVKARQLLADQEYHPDVTELVDRVIRISRRDAKCDEPKHFFCVELLGVDSFHQDELMSPPRLATYLSQVCPVPFDYNRFAFAERIDRHLTSVEGYSTYRIFLNGAQIYRPHQNDVVARKKDCDQIRDVNLFAIQNQKGQEIARGWYAQTAYKSSLPAHVTMRGVRVRQGNIQIGDEYFLADCYSERRFATWHIGEIHASYRLKTNARRDGFEQAADYEALLEYMNILGRQLGQFCRISSKNRSMQSRTDRARSIADQGMDRLFVVNSKHFKMLRENAKSACKLLADAKSKRRSDALLASRLEKTYEDNDTFIPRLRDVIDERLFRKKRARDIVQEIAEALVAHHKPNQQLNDLLDSMFKPFVKKSARSGRRSLPE